MLKYMTLKRFDFPITAASWETQQAKRLDRSMTQPLAIGFTVQEAAHSDIWLHQPLYLRSGRSTVHVLCVPNQILATPSGKAATYLRENVDFPWGFEGRPICHFLRTFYNTVCVNCEAVGGYHLVIITFIIKILFSISYFWYFLIMLNTKR